jgi:general secretion pathway protein K
VALLAVMAALAVVATFTLQYAYESNIDYASAVNAKDEMRAHYLARSGMNLSRLAIKVQKDVVDKYRKQLGDMQIADYLPMIMGAFGGGKDEVESLAALAGNIDTSRIKGLGLSDGEFSVDMSTDDGKINVNCAGGSAKTQEQLALVLSALVASPQYDRLFEDRDADGQYTDRQTFVSAIIDWIDRDTALFGTSGAPEQYGYESFEDPYEPRNNYIDSIDELQLVRGMDDRRWELFGPAFTIYGGCKVNVAAANDLNVIVALIWQTAKNPDDPVLRDPVRLYTLAAVVAMARQVGYPFTDLNDFAEFVKDPAAAILGIFGGGEEGQPQDLSQFDPTGGLLSQVQGVELNTTELQKIARAGGRRTYRIVSSARIGRVEKTISGVFDTDTTNQNVRDPAYLKGAWLYWRED